MECVPRSCKFTLDFTRKVYKSYLQVGRYLYVYVGNEGDWYSEILTDIKFKLYLFHIGDIDLTYRLL